MSIALKEANETDYWLDLADKTMEINEKSMFELKERCKIVKLNHFREGTKMVSMDEIMAIGNRRQVSSEEDSGGQPTVLETATLMWRIE